MTISRRIYTIAAIGAAAVIVAAFATIYAYPSVWRHTPDDSGTAKSTLRLAVLTDANFSDMGWGGSSLKAAKFIEQKYGFDVATEDNVAIPDIEATLSRYADAGYDLIIAHGFQWGGPALKVGSEHPKIKIVVFTGLVESNNVASIFPQQQEGSFLLGALAGMMTKTNAIGFVGGEEYPNVVNIFEGYKQGAKSVNANVTIIGTYLNDWDNPPRGRGFHINHQAGRGLYVPCGRLVRSRCDSGSQRKRDLRAGSSAGPEWPCA